jgi:hypothetical protein
MRAGWQQRKSVESRGNGIRDLSTSTDPSKACAWLGSYVNSCVLEQLS